MKKNLYQCSPQFVMIFVLFLVKHPQLVRFLCLHKQGLLITHHLLYITNHMLSVRHILQLMSVSQTVEEKFLSKFQKNNSIVKEDLEYE